MERRHQYSHMVLYSGIRSLTDSLRPFGSCGVSNGGRHDAANNAACTWRCSHGCFSSLRLHHDAQTDKKVTNKNRLTRDEARRLAANIAKLPEKLTDAASLWPGGKECSQDKAVGDATSRRLCLRPPSAPMVRYGTFGLSADTFTVRQKLIRRTLTAVLGRHRGPNLVIHSVSSALVAASSPRLLTHLLS